MHGIIYLFRVDYAMQTFGLLVIYVYRPCWRRGGYFSVDGFSLLYSSICNGSSCTSATNYSNSFCFQSEGKPIENKTSSIDITDILDFNLFIALSIASINFLNSDLDSVYFKLITQANKSLLYHQHHLHKYR